MKARKEASREFLDLFYPIHYQVGIQIEDALRSGILTRQQTCILWTIRTEGQDGRVMRRKDIERALSSWYEVTSSAVSKSLRALTKPPMDLLSMVEDPDNGREKLVELTSRGQSYVENMIRRGTALMDTMVARLTDEEISTGIHFLTRVSEINRELEAEAAAVTKTPQKANS